MTLQKSGGSLSIEKEFNLEVFPGRSAPAAPAIFTGLACMKNSSVHEVHAPEVQGTIQTALDDHPSLWNMRLLIEATYPVRISSSAQNLADQPYGHTHVNLMALMKSVRELLYVGPQTPSHTPFGPSVMAHPPCFRRG